MNEDQSGSNDTKKPGGNGQPPMHSRWKKGQSGNPEGRPKGALNLKTLVGKAAKSKVQITINGQTKSMSGLAALVEMIKLRALQGKGQSEARMLDLYRDFLPIDEEVGLPSLSAEELEALKNYAYLAELLGTAGMDEDTEPDTLSGSKPPSKPAAKGNGK